MLRCFTLQSLDAKLDVRQLLQMTHLEQSLPITKKHHVTCKSVEVYFVHPEVLHILIKIIEYSYNKIWDLYFYCDVPKFETESSGLCITILIIIHLEA